MKTLDMSPSWVEILPMLLSSFQEGSPESRRIAIEELVHMAKLSDIYASTINKQKVEASI